MTALTERGRQPAVPAGAGGDPGRGGTSGDCPRRSRQCSTTRIDGLAPASGAAALGVRARRPRSTPRRSRASSSTCAVTSTRVLGPPLRVRRADPAVAGGFRFRHALIRDAAYEGLSYRRRRELHGRVAETLEPARRRSLEVAELLSLHYVRAGRHAEAWHYSQEAGDRARAKWANREAVELYRRALEVAADVPGLEPAAVSRGLGGRSPSATRLQSEFSDAAEALAAAREARPTAGPEAVRLMGKEGLLHEDWGHYADAIRWYERGLEAADALAIPTSGFGIASTSAWGYAQTCFRQGRFQDCIARCREVVDEALPAGTRRRWLPPTSCCTLVHTLLGLARPGGLPRACAAALRGARRPERPGEHAEQPRHRGVLRRRLAEGDRAVRSGAESCASGSATPSASRSRTTTSARSSPTRDASTRHESCSRQPSRRAKQAGQRWLATLGRANIGYVEARAGNLDGAAALLAEAAATFAELDATSYVLETKVRQAEVAALEGNGAAALALSDEVIADAGDAAGMVALQSSVHRIRATALHQLGDDVDGAGREVDESISIARTGDASLQLALALDLLALIDDDRDAAAAERRAARAARRRARRASSATGLVQPGGGVGRGHQQDDRAGRRCTLPSCCSLTTHGSWLFGVRGRRRRCPRRSAASGSSGPA